MTSPPEGFVPISGAQDVDPAGVRSSNAMGIVEWIGEALEAGEMDQAAEGARQLIAQHDAGNVFPVRNQQVAQWVTATRMADMINAGDVEGASKLRASAIKMQQPEPGLKDVLTAVADGLSFNFTDELVGLAAQVAGKSDDEVDKIVRRVRGGRRSLQEKHPVGSFLASVAPALVTGAGVGGALRTTGARIGAGAGTGALSGLGAGEGDLAARAPGAIAGGLIGGAAGAVIPAVGERLARRLGGTAGEAVEGVAGRQLRHQLGGAGETIATRRASPAADKARDVLTQMSDEGLTGISANQLAQRAGVSASTARKVLRQAREAPTATASPATAPAAGSATPTVQRTSPTLQQQLTASLAQGKGADEVADQIIALQRSGQAEAAQQLARSLRGRGNDFVRAVMTRVGRELDPSGEALETVAQRAAAQQPPAQLAMAGAAEKAARRGTRSSPTTMVRAAVEAMDPAERRLYQRELVEQLEGAIVRGEVRAKGASGKKALEMLRAAFSKDKGAGRAIIRRFESFLKGDKPQRSLGRRAAGFAAENVLPLPNALSRPLGDFLRGAPPPQGSFPLGQLGMPNVLPPGAVGAPSIAASVVAPGLLPGMQ